MDYQHKPPLPKLTPAKEKRHINWFLILIAIAFIAALGFLISYIFSTLQVGALNNQVLTLERDLALAKQTSYTSEPLSTSSKDMLSSDQAALQAAYDASDLTKYTVVIHNAWEITDSSHAPYQYTSVPLKHEESDTLVVSAYFYRESPTSDWTFAYYVPHQAFDCDAYNFYQLRYAFADQSCYDNKGDITVVSEYYTRN